MATWLENIECCLSYKDRVSYLENKIILTLKTKKQVNLKTLVGEVIGYKSGWLHEWSEISGFLDATNNLIRRGELKIASCTYVGFEGFDLQIALSNNSH